MEFDETLGVPEAATLLRADGETVMQYARRGELPGTRIGKSWVFMREDVLAFLRKQINDDTEERRRNRPMPTAMLVVATPKRGRRKPVPDLPELPEQWPDALPKPGG